MEKTFAYSYMYQDLCGMYEKISLQIMFRRIGILHKFKQGL